MDGCWPCTCGSKKLIPDIYIGKDEIVVAIRCDECGNESEKFENYKDSILNWNRMVLNIKRNE